MKLNSSLIGRNEKQSSIVVEKDSPSKVSFQIETTPVAKKNSPSPDQKKKKSAEKAQMIEVSQVEHLESLLSSLPDTISN